MALDRLTDGSGTPGPLTGNTYLDQVAEEILGLWNRSVITLSAVSGTNTITATVTPALLSGLVSGMMFILIPAATNTTAVTLNGAAVLDADGNALTAGALRINNHYLLWTNGTNYYVVGYTPAAQVAVGTKLISKVLLTTARSSIDFVHGAVPTDGTGTVVLDGTYDAYTLKINSCAPATDDVEAWLRVGTGAGPTYQTTGYTAYCRMSAGASGADVASVSFNQIPMTRQSGTVDVGNASGETFSATINFNGPAVNKFFECHGQSNYRCANSSLGGGHFIGGYNTQSAITALRFQFETGNISTGSAQLYGHTLS